jgi:hypothetical protein
MRLALCVLLVASLVLAGCGDGRSAHGFFPPGSTPITTSGFVDTIQFTSIPDLSGSFIDVTIITLVQPDFDFFSETTFCGDAVRFFPFDVFITVRFVPANPCVISFTVET